MFKKENIIEFLQPIKVFLPSIVISTYLSIYYMCFEGKENSSMEKINASIFLGFFLFALASIFNNKVNKGLKYKISSNLIALIMIIVYYVSSPVKYLKNDITIYVGLVLFIVVLSVFTEIIKREEGYLSSYLKEIIKKLLITYLFTLALYLGLMMIYFTVSKLFNINYNEFYSKIGISVFGIFSPIYLLYNYPMNLPVNIYEKKDEILNFFLKYIMFGLLVVYFIVLYMYLFSIIFTGNFPKGIVSFMVLGYSIFSIIFILLSNNFSVFTRHSKKLALAYYISLIPLIFLMFVGLYKRVIQYGITENRYFIIAFGIWVLINCLYNILNKKRKMEFIIYSIIVVMFFSLVSPISAFKISEYYQKNELKQILKQSGLLVDNKIINNVDVNPETKSKISAIVRYFYEAQGYKKLESIFGKIEEKDEYEFTKKLGFAYSETNGFNFDESGKINEGNKEQYFSLTNDGNVNISDKYDKILMLKYIKNQFKEKIQGSYKINCEKNKIYIKKNSVIEVDISKIVTNISKTQSLGISSVLSDKITVVFENNEISVKIVFLDLEGMSDLDGVEIDKVNALLLIKEKK